MENDGISFPDIEQAGIFKYIIVKKEKKCNQGLMHDFTSSYLTEFGKK